MRDIKLPKERLVTMRIAVPFKMRDDLVLLSQAVPLHLHTLVTGLIRRGIETEHAECKRDPVARNEWWEQLESKMSKGLEE